MPRAPRNCPGGFVYHIWNRSAGRLRLFKKEGDYLAFEQILIETCRRFELPLLDWCLMPNHWHFAVYPKQDDAVSHFFRWLANTHAMRWHVAHRAVGTGPLYQGRFKSLPVQRDEHLLTLLRYVQRNPVRAKLAPTAAAWRWGSEHVRQHGPPELTKLLSPWPVDRPSDWTRFVNRPQTDAELAALRTAVKRSRPFGSPQWTVRTAKQLGMQWTLNPRGRPRLEGKEVRPL